MQRCTGERTNRRLAQNREAARKSRQRRKDYVQKLEAEVRATAWLPLCAGEEYVRPCKACAEAGGWSAGGSLAAVMHGVGLYRGQVRSRRLSC